MRAWLAILFTVCLLAACYVVSALTRRLTPHAFHQPRLIRPYSWVILPKKFRIFFRALLWEIIGKSAKTPQKTPQITPKNTRILMCFLQRLFCASLNPQLTQLTSFELTAAMAFDFVL